MSIPKKPLRHDIRREGKAYIHTMCNKAFLKPKPWNADSQMCKDCLKLRGVRFP